MIIPAVTVPEGAKGNWRIERFEIGSEPTIATLRLAFSGRGILPGKYTRLVHAQRGVVMSDTTAERGDHYAFVRAARGHVLINGLGLGMCLQAVLDRRTNDGQSLVTAATVVELDPDVIALVGPHYASDPRVEIVQASAFDYQPPKGIRYGAVWHDIWDTICEDNLPEMHKLHRKYGRLCDWQGSWGRDTIEAERRRERRWW